MNQFELEMKRLKCTCDHDILRIERNKNGIRRGGNRRIWSLKSECYAKINGLETERLGLKKKLYSITDMKVRFEMMQRVSELERDIRQLKVSRDIHIQEEQGELAARMEELDIEIRGLRNERDNKLLEIKERYIEWIENHKKSDNHEEI